MTVPMAPAPVPPPAGQGAPPPPVDPGQVPPPPAPADQPQDQGGQSPTDAAAGDPMQWLVAAEADARYGAIERPTLDTGLLGE